MLICLSKLFITLFFRKKSHLYRLEYFTFYNFENFVQVKLMAYKIIQPSTGDQSLYIMNTVQKIRLSVAVQL